MKERQKKEIKKLRFVIALIIMTKGEKGIDSNTPKMMNLIHPVRISCRTKVIAVGGNMHPEHSVNSATLTYKLKTKNSERWANIGEPCKFKTSPRKLMKILMNLDFQKN